MSYLHCLSLFAYSGVQHILCCGFGGGFFFACLSSFCVLYDASFS
jgi:hypothetical protein